MDNKLAVDVRMEGLTKVFLSGSGKSKESFMAVDNITLNVEPGELLSLLGPSGCGKSTTLRMLSGFEVPTSGKIFFGDKDVTETTPSKRDVGMMFQSYALFPHLTVYENIAYGLRIKKHPKNVLEKKMNDVLTLMHITSLSQRLPNEISGGQQQRVALARAVVIEPQIMLFDEPLSNLDAKMREYMRDELRKLQQRLNITSVYVTHDQSEAMAISDRIVVMNKGIIEQIGTPHEIYTQPNNYFVANFIGKANFIEAVVATCDGSHMEAEIGGKKTRMSVGKNHVFKVGEKILCLVRPEFIHFLDNASPDDGIPAVVQHTSYFGSHIEYTLEVDGVLLTMVDHDILNHKERKRGEKVLIRFEQSFIHPLPWVDKDARGGGL